MNISIVEPADLDNTLMIAECLQATKYVGVQEYRNGNVKILNCSGKSYLHMAIRLQKIVGSLDPSLRRDFYPCLLFWN